MQLGTLLLTSIVCVSINVYSHKVGRGGLSLGGIPLSHPLYQTLCCMLEQHLSETCARNHTTIWRFRVETLLCSVLGIMGTIKSLEGDKQQMFTTAYTKFIPAVCDQISCGPVLNLSAVYVVVEKHIYPCPVHAGACGGNL